jgi:DNA polymerase III epsilon subunit-like protein
MPHFLFFDLETTGLIKLPKNEIDFRKIDAFPEIVQISWQLYFYKSDSFEHLKTRDYIIRPENYSIPEDSSKIHGITNEIALKNGVEKTTVISELIEDIRNHKNIHLVCHNIEFDVTVLFFHIYRNFKDIFNEYIHAKIPCICTMLDTVSLCKIPHAVLPKYRNRSPYKFPKLCELYLTLFAEEPNGQLHNSSVDVEVLVKCFMELINRKHEIKVRYASFITDLSI